ncbi:MAG TPA: AbrB/MazE/SpoVT family DNA-binding domain-containing protein [Gammaproteobacteria bacterium]|nr:AbrB/MazE/SpoVT family DNA-binding domain-containing protein [Gammaproteobacteria bacterium]
MSNTAKFTPDRSCAMVVQVDAEGGVTIPISVWRELGIRDGDRITLSQDGDSIKIKPAKSKGSGNE